MNRSFFRRTRGKHYYRMPDGTLRVVLNTEQVSHHDNVCRRPVEYTRPAKKAPPKSKPKKKSPMPVRVRYVTAAIRSARKKINQKARGATRVFPTIDLDASSVPKARLIRSRKQLRKSKSHVHSMDYYVALFIFI